MTATPIAFQTNSSDLHYEGVAALFNAHAEKRDPDAKGPLAVRGSDGLVEFTDSESDTPCRGLIYLPDLDKLYHAHANSCYKTTYDGSTATTVRIGTVPGTDPVQLSRNQKADPEVVVQSNYGAQVIAGDTLSDVNDADLLDDIVTAEYAHGYSVYGFEDRRYQWSDINSAKVVAALDFSTFQQQAGKLIKVVENRGDLYGFCTQHFEAHRDTGQETVFQPVAFKSRGLMAKNAIAKCDGTLMFVGDDGCVYRLNNYEPIRISTHHIERLIRDDANQDDLRAFGWTRGGHAFFSLTGSDWTRVFDATTQVWHSRESRHQDTWRARYATPAWGKIIFGDGLSGKLFYPDSDTYTEDDETMIWGVDSPTLHAFPNGGILDAVHFDIATGYGTLSGQGSDPKLMLQVSTDGGTEFGQYRELELGVTGRYSTRVTARRLGRFGPKGCVLRLRISDPVARSLVGTDVEVRGLKR